MHDPRHEPDEVADGYVFTGDDGWKPAPPAPPAPPERRRRMRSWLVGASALLLALIALRGLAAPAPELASVACAEVTAAVDDYIDQREENLALAADASGVETDYQRSADTATALALQTVVDNPRCFNPGDVVAARGALPIVQARLAR